MVRACKSERKWVAAMAVSVLLNALLAATSHAATRILAVDPVRSSLQLSTPESLIEIDVGLPFVLATVPLVSQGPGATLPDGSQSDGMRTSLSGSLLLEVDGSSLRVVGRRSTLFAGTSGSYLPGLPLQGATPAPADLATSFSQADLGIAALIAMREVLATYDLPQTALSASGPSSSSFDAATGSSVLLLSSNWAFDLGLAPLAGSNVLRRYASTNTAVSLGELVDLGAGELEIIVPLSVALDIPADLTLGFPFEASLLLTGQIVATTLPEPAASLLLLAGILVLACLAAIRRPAPLAARGRGTNTLRAVSIALLGACLVTCMPTGRSEDQACLDEGCCFGEKPTGVIECGDCDCMCIECCVEDHPTALCLSECDECEDLETEGGSEVDDPGCGELDKRASASGGTAVDDEQIGSCPLEGSISSTGTNTSGVTNTVTNEHRVEGPNPPEGVIRFVQSCGLETDGPPGENLSPSGSCTNDNTFSFEVTAPPGEMPAIHAQLVVSTTGDGADNPTFTRVTMSCPGAFVIVRDGELPQQVVLSGPGTCTVNFDHGGNMRPNGLTNYHAALVVYPSACDRADICPDERPFCSGVCHDGLEGNLCRHDTECAEGLLCSSAFQCQDGSPGDACIGDSDCQGSCDASLCVAS